MSGKGCVYMSMHAASVVSDVPRKRLVAGAGGGSGSGAGSNRLQNSSNHKARRKTVPSSGAGGIATLCTENLVAAPTSSKATAATAVTTTTATGIGRLSMQSLDQSDPCTFGDDREKPALYNVPNRLETRPWTNNNDNTQSSSNQQAVAQPQHLTQSEAKVPPRTVGAEPHARQRTDEKMNEEDCSDSEDDSSISSSRSFDSDESCSSGSSFSTSSEASGPQHQFELMDETVHPDLEYAVIAHRKKGMLLSRLSDVSTRGTLSVINLARRGLGLNDVALIEQVILGNPNLKVLKLGYNDVGDVGALCIANAICMEVERGFEHRPVRVLDLSFNGIGDDGCEALAVKAVAGNISMRTLFLTGNNIGEKGALSIAGALVHGCSLSRLHLSANKIGPEGVKALATAVAEVEARLQMQESRDGQNVVAATTENDVISPDRVQNAIRAQRMEHLFLESTLMESNGFYAIPSMLVSNTALRVLCLSDNGIDDRDMSVLGQALTQNKSVPLEVLQLSFNQITCVGVECLMNSIWGSPTLKEITLDNNKMKDRGAQLCAVVLTSIKLQKLDIGFNEISTVGIRALMKSLSEDANVRSLGMCGIPIDLNAAKAVSFALAYNAVLETIYLDNCEVGYSAQRHIVAGIVSNQKAPLKVMTGYPIGPITVTLGMPQLPEEWSNEQVLAFVRMMWRNWGKKRGPSSSNGGAEEEEEEVKGPAPPAAVAAAAKIAFAALGSDPSAALYVEPREAVPYESDVAELQSPLAPANAALIERTLSGRFQVPSSSNAEDGDGNGFLEAWTEESALGRPTATFHVSGGPALDPPLENPEQRNRNLRWLRTHFRPLIDVGKLPFNNADMWQLHQYYFSPPYFDDDNEDSKPPAAEDGKRDAEDAGIESECTTDAKKDSKNIAPPSTPDTSASSSKSIGRAISFQALSSAVAAAHLTNGCQKRRGHDEPDVSPAESEPVSKRSKSLKPRIAYYPRIRAKLESLGTKPLDQTLSLLRKLKYVENVIFPEHTTYEDLDRLRESEHATRLDVEMILLDLI